MKPTFHITQNSPLIDTKLEIRITNLPPYETVTVKADMWDNNGMKWESFAELISDGEGNIDLATAKPKSGTYLTPDVTGLFWSMCPNANVNRKKRTPLEPLETTLSLMKDQEVLASTQIVREVVSPEVERKPVRERGLVGTFFFHPDSEPLPTVLMLGGSEGGLRESSAALLASHGFNTFALAYFGIEDLPKELVNIPLDYIEEAIEWLSNNSHVDTAKLGIFGTSKGGELALLGASMFPVIKAVVGYVPSGVVYPGLGQSASGGSSWQYKGKSLPFAYGDVPKMVMEELEQTRHAREPISYRKTYQYWAQGEKRAEIAVEDIQGPILLISGGDDQLWPSDVLSEKVISRLKEHNHSYRYEHIQYPDAGHSFSVPGYSTAQSVITPFGSGNLLLGGTPKDNAQAQFDAWYRMIGFFNDSLKT